MQETKKEVILSSHAKIGTKSQKEISRFLNFKKLRFCHTLTHLYTKFFLSPNKILGTKKFGSEKNLSLTKILSPTKILGLKNFRVQINFGSKTNFGSNNFW